MLIVDLINDNAELKFSAHQRMTTAIVDTVHRAGGCGPSGILAQGFTPDEIQSHWQVSKTLAHIELNLMDAA